MNPETDNQKGEPKELYKRTKLGDMVVKMLEEKETEPSLKMKFTLTFKLVSEASNALNAKDGLESFLIENGLRFQLVKIEAGDKL